MKRLIAFLLLAIIPCSLKADVQTFGGNWGGLNDGDASILIGDSEAQDLLNVDITDNQFGIRKRDGYAQFQPIGVSTWPVRGGYYFTDVNGNNLLVHASSTTIYKSLNSGTYTAFVTTDTAGSYYDLTDSQGYLWRATSNRDEILRYSGSAVTYYTSHPKGNQIEALPDRLAISGTAANPNRVHFSGAADFTTFTTGINDTDPFTEDFSLPGQAINVIKYAMGRLYAWTNTTTSFWSGDNQFDGIIKDVSTNIGCNQPDSILYDSGVIFWQAQDKHFYSFDGNEIRKISEKINGSVSDFVGGYSKLQSLSDRTDWETGVSSQVSTSLSIGDVVLSTWTDLDTSTANFQSGTSTNMYVSDGKLILLSTGNPVDYGFSLGFVGPNSYGWETKDLGSCGTNVWSFAAGYDALGNGMLPREISGGSIVVDVRNTSNAIVATSTQALPSDSTWHQYTGPSMASLGGQQVTIALRGVGGFCEARSSTFTASGSDFTYYALRSVTFPRGVIDAFAGGAMSSGTFTSRTFDTALTSAAWLASSVSSTTNSNTISYWTQSSSDGAVWNSSVAWTNGDAPGSTAARYIRYLVYMSSSATSASSLPFVSDVTLAARASTGTWTSPTITIGSGITSWGNFGTDTTLNGGTVNFAIRTATSAAMLTSASYSSVSDNTLITASTNPYAQVKFDSSITLGTQTPTVSNFTLFWNEGTPTHTFGAIDKNHRLLWSVAEDGATTNNATYIYDQRFDSWLKYSVPFNAPVHVGDSLYFGGASTGAVYIHPTGDNDDGSAITAYWKTKDFIGSDPFVEKGYSTLSLIADTEVGSSLYVDTYINGVTTSTKTYTVSLTNSTLPYIRFNDRFPNGLTGTLINFKFGNTATDSPFEFYSARYDYTPKAWRVLP